MTDDKSKIYSTSKHIAPVGVLASAERLVSKRLSKAAAIKIYGIKASGDGESKSINYGNIDFSGSTGHVLVHILNCNLTLVKAPLTQGGYTVQAFLHLEVTASGYTTHATGNPPVQTAIEILNSARAVIAAWNPAGSFNVICGENDTPHDFSTELDPDVYDLAVDATLFLPSVNEQFYQC